MKKTEEDYRLAASNSKSIAGMCRYLDVKPSGGNYKIMHDAIAKYSIDVSHFTGQGWNVGLAFIPKQATPLEELLINGSRVQSFKLKNRILKEGIKDYRCERCGLTEWLGNKIPLELHHINGIVTDNRLDNLLLLCPNCHALTSNYRGLNKSATKETL